MDSTTSLQFPILVWIKVGGGSGAGESIFRGVFFRDSINTERRLGKLNTDFDTKVTTS